MNKIYLICDFRENFPSKIFDGNILFNDHPRRSSVEEIRDIYNELGYDCEIFGGVPELVHAIENNEKYSDCIFINMSDGMTQTYSRVQIPILCDLLGVTYSGSDPFVVALMTNKHYSKLAAKEAGILVSPGFLVTPQNFSFCIEDLKIMTYPVIVKPNLEGSSIGISNDNVCSTFPQLINLLNSLLVSFNELVVESYVAGYEITDFLIGNLDDIVLHEVLGIQHHGKILFENEVITLKDNAEKTTSYFLPETIFDETIIRTIKTTTLKVAKYMNVHDILRIDYRLTQKGELYFLEINSVPRISSTSELGFICTNRGFSYKEILDRYLKSIQNRLIHD